MTIEHNHMEESCFRPGPCPRCSLNEAAPKLLDACKAFISYQDASEKGRIDPNESFDAFESVVIQVKAAIAEAEK